MDVIKQLMTQGRYHEALSELENLGTDQEMDKLRLKSSILNRLGEYHQGYMVAEKTIKLSEKQNSLPKLLYSLSEKANSCVQLFKTDEANSLLEQAQKLISTMNDTERDQTKEEQALFLSVVGDLGNVADTISDPQSALEQSITHWKELDQPAGVAQALHLLGSLNSDKTHMEAALKIWNKLGNDYERANTLCKMGSLYRAEGNLKAAMEFNQKALAISQELEYKVGSASALQCIGSNYEVQGDITQALGIHHQILQIYHKMDVPFSISSVLMNLGNNYLKQLELEKARDYFQRAYSERQKQHLKPEFVANPLFLLVQVELAINNREKAHNYQQQIQHIINRAENPSPEAMHYFQVAKALILKSSKRLKDKIEAQNILEALLQQETDIRPWSLNEVVVRNLCELLLEELKLYGEPEVLAEIETLLNKLQSTAQDQFQYSTIVEMLILRAKLELLDGKLQQAQHILDNAHAITLDKGLTLLQRQIEQEQKQLEKNFMTWTDLVKRNAPMKERIKEAQLDEYIINALKLSVNDN